MKPNEAKNFYDWLSFQSHRRDEVGELARHALDDQAWPKESGNKAELRSHLRKQGHRDLVRPLAITLKEYSKRNQSDFQQIIKDGTQGVIFAGSNAILPLGPGSEKLPQTIDVLEKTIKLISRIEPTWSKLRSKFFKLAIEQTRDENIHRAQVLGYYFDRITASFLNIVSIVNENHLYSYPNAGLIARSMVEDCVNSILIIEDKNNEFLASLYQNSFDADKKQRTDLNEFKIHPDPRISLAIPGELKQVSPDDDDWRSEQLDIIGFTGTPRKLKNFKERCADAGETWSFLYATRYRQLSAWGHGHMSEHRISPTNSSFRQYRVDEAPARAITMLHFSVHIIFLFCSDLANRLNTSSNRLEILFNYFNIKLTALLDDLDTIERPFKDSEGRDLSSRDLKRRKYVNSD